VVSWGLSAGLLPCTAGTNAAALPPLPVAAGAATAAASTAGTIPLGFLSMGAPRPELLSPTTLPPLPAAADAAAVTAAAAAGADCTSRSAAESLPFCPSGNGSLADTPSAPPAPPLPIMCRRVTPAQLNGRPNPGFTPVLLPPSALEASASRAMPPLLLTGTLLAPACKLLTLG
jgi:hypothetical protein